MKGTKNKVNYIYHLSSSMEVIANDDSLTASHLSLYLALFHAWNNAKFKAKIAVYRSHVMRYSGIGSTATYHKCIKQLESSGLLKYLPSKNIYKPSEVTLFRLDTPSESVLNKLCISSKQALIQYLKHLKNFKRNIDLIDHSKEEIIVPPTIVDVIHYFESKSQSQTEANKFYAYCRSKGWMLTKDLPIIDWMAKADLWMLRSKDFANEKNNYRSDDSPVEPSKHNGYEEPL